MKNYWRMKDAERFEESLDRLKSKMLLLGYRDYPDVCSEITKMIEEGKLNLQEDL